MFTCREAILHDIHDSCISNYL